MADELDLERGDPSRADDRSERRRRRRSGSSSETKKEPPSERVAAEISNRLERVFDRIAKALEARGDDELAEVVREDSEAMTQGFVSLTSSFVPLRLPLLMILNLVEPLLAFGRVARILAIRMVMRRERKAAEREAMQAEFSENGGGGQVPVA